MNINLHIDRLILDNVNIAPHQQHLLQASIETELTRLLTENGLSSQFTQGTALPKVAGNPLHITDNNPSQLGQQIAQSIYGGIGHE